MPCNATAPEVGISIGDRAFYYNPDDLFITGTGFDGICFSAIQTSLAAFTIPLLGASSSQSALAIIDLGNMEMTFMGRP